MVTATTRPAERLGVLRGAPPAFAGGGAGLGPFGIRDYDGPKTIRLRKYATGTHVLLEEVGVETGATPRRVAWTRNKAHVVPPSQTGATTARGRDKETVCVDAGHVGMLVGQAAGAGPWPRDRLAPRSGR